MGAPQNSSAIAGEKPGSGIAPFPNSNEKKPGVSSPVPTNSDQPGSKSNNASGLFSNPSESAVKKNFSSPSSAGGAIPAATFVVKNITDPTCIGSKKSNEIFFLVELLKEEISRVSLSSQEKNACFDFYAKKLAEQKTVTIDDDALADKIRIRLHFGQQTAAPAVNGAAPTRTLSGDSEKTKTSTLSSSGSMGGKTMLGGGSLSGGSLKGSSSMTGGAPKKSETKQTETSQTPPITPLQNNSSAATNEISLTINGEDVEIQKDGWFAYEPASTDSVMVMVRQGNQVRFLKSLAPELIKTGINERKSDAYRYAYLISNAANPIAMITAERLDFKSLIDVSLPFYLKASYGYTRLFPLPGEGQVDRPTLIAGVKTHPILYGMHIAAEGFFSAKSDSQIPWTSLVTTVIGSDFLELGNNLSLPWGVGLRGFESKIDNSKAASDPSGAKGRTLIPESVLGPAAMLGVKYRNNYIFSDLTLTIAPLQIPGSDLIVTYNPSVYVGYQMTGADTVTLNFQTHDVRFPTTSKVVKVTASIIAIGYMRDLQ